MPIICFINSGQRGNRCIITDNIAAAFTRLHIASIDQCLIGQHNGIARHAQLLCQHAAGGQFITRQNGACQNGLDHRFANLRLEAGVRLGIKMDNQMIQHLFPAQSCG